MATPTTTAAAKTAAATKASSAATAAKASMASQAAAKQSALSLLQSAVKAKTTGIGSINSAAANSAAQTAIDLSNQAVAAQQTATTAASENATIQALPLDTTPVISTDTQDAFALLEQTFNQYGLESLAPLIKGYMQQNMGPNQAALLLKQTPEYKARFAGNFTRQAAGLNMLSEAEYLALENSYTNLFGSYGVKNLANRNQFATLIGNDVSSTELNSRLDLAVNQVQNADPTVVATLKQFYPSVSNQDLVSYFLAPGETLPKLQMQVQSADIGAAATQQGLSTSQASAEALAKYGVTYGQAQTGYGKIAEALPASQKLSQIYGAQTGINYDQTEAEAQYLKNSGAAALEQQKLADLEKQQFSGRSGVLGANVAAGYGGSLGKSIQGSF
jgi:hypothetical protein